MSEKNLVNKKVDSDDDDDDDDDYCPTKTHDEQADGSDESEHNDDDDNDNDDDTANDQNQQMDNRKQNDLSITPYDDSKTNELWKTFTSSTKSSSTKMDSPKTTIEIPKSTIQNSKPVTANKILEFAGEKISVPVPVTTTTTTSTENSSLKRPASSSTTSNSVLDRLGIGKKQKLSTLEKSRLDWKTHKESESLADDLESHRRGKDSYVERKAFLQRSELRQHDHYLSNVKKK
ncbi:unnamed protein product [Rotaria sp. Silwood1]|nr:unnamed protein product [Rotaria sp. Silwood1]CAF0902777.1 unnamed protein product [Rotaria sp. Silwood1]CAF3378046.1 unnamed protein product [Rotaria sp. Silwood1]